MRAFTITSEQVRANLLEYIRGIDMDGRLQRVVINDYRKNKTQEQLGYLWGVVLPTISQHIEDSNGQHFTDEEIYGWFIDEYANSRPVTINNRCRIVKTTASQMSTAEMSNFIDRIIMHAAEHMQCVIPVAE